jgi:ABC-type polar amino acid transport system ATPase subunit
MSASPTMIAASEITKHYGRLEVLKGVSLGVERGQVKVVVGPSGSGKSTLLRCLALLEPIESGSIVLDGEDVAWRARGGRGERSLVPFRSQLCMVFQHFNLFPHLTALENVMIGPVHVRGVDRKEARAEAMALLARVRLGDKAERYPHELSGGQQQRVAIARALANRPKLLIADEPTGNLDPKTAEDVFEVLVSLVRGGDFGALVATHNLNLAGRMDRVMELRDGILVQH